MASALASPSSSALSSRGTTPTPQINQPNPYRLPRFWRGFIVGGLTIPGLYGLYRLGSFLMGNNNQNKFNKQQIPAIGYEERRALPTPNPKPTPSPTPPPKQMRLYNNIHR